MLKLKGNKYIRIYHGYGHTHNLVVYAHLFRRKPSVSTRFSNSAWKNIVHLFKLFTVAPVPKKQVRLNWRKQQLSTTSEADGFIKFEWESDHDVNAGWHPVQMTHEDETGLTQGEGKIFVPHITQFAFISDIDDTIMVSHSATIWRRLKELFTLNPHTRSVFDGVAEHYRLLSRAHTDEVSPNPFFYVSSSEWNLYDYLLEVFRHNKLPEGAFLLNQVKRWYQLLKTGKTKHQGKLLRVVRIMETFPNQRFVLLGDNSQSDPFIYQSIAEKYPDRVHAIYIRNVHAGKAPATASLLQTLQQSAGVHTCFFVSSHEAIAHSRSIGLITDTKS